MFIQVQVRRSVSGRETDFISENDGSANVVNNLKPPILRKGKLVVVDLAGSERILKSGALDNSSYFVILFLLFLLYDTTVFLCTIISTVASFC